MKLKDILLDDNSKGGLTVTLLWDDGTHNDHNINTKSVLPLIIAIKRGVNEKLGE